MRLSRYSLEAGFQIHLVREMLGHSNVSQTSTYLNAGRMGLQEAMKRIDASRCNPVAIRPSSEPPTDCNEATGENAKHLVN